MTALRCRYTTGQATNESSMVVKYDFIEYILYILLLLLKRLHIGMYSNWLVCWDLSGDSVAYSRYSLVMPTIEIYSDKVTY